MAAIATTGLTKYYGGAIAVDNHARAQEEERTNNLLRYDMERQR